LSQRVDTCRINLHHFNTQWRHLAKVNNAVFRWWTSSALMQLTVYVFRKHESVCIVFGRQRCLVLRWFDLFLFSLDGINNWLWCNCRVMETSDDSHQDNLQNDATQPHGAGNSVGVHAQISSGTTSTWASSGTSTSTDESRNWTAFSFARILAGTLTDFRKIFVFIIRACSMNVCFLVIGWGVSILQGLKIVISFWLNRSPLTQGWRYRAAPSVISPPSLKLTRPSVV